MLKKNEQLLYRKGALRNPIMIPPKAWRRFLLMDAPTVGTSTI